MTELPNARITPTGGVFIGGVELPGLIAENGVTVTPGGHRDVNTLMVTFLVGEVSVEDSTT
jgi:hypothetical protein